MTRNGAGSGGGRPLGFGAVRLELVDAHAQTGAQTAHAIRNLNPQATPSRAPRLHDDELDELEAGFVTAARDLGRPTEPQPPVFIAAFDQPLKGLPADPLPATPARAATRGQELRMVHTQRKRLPARPTRHPRRHPRPAAQPELSAATTTRAPRKQAPMNEPLRLAPAHKHTAPGRARSQDLEQ